LFCFVCFCFVCFCFVFVSCFCFFHVRRYLNVRIHDHRFPSDCLLNALKSVFEKRRSRP
jgi:tellurite resistance protein TehA-like permease